MTRPQWLGRQSQNHSDIDGEPDGDDANDDHAALPGMNSGRAGTSSASISEAVS
jgi:hypothetical protein